MMQKNFRKELKQKLRERKTIFAGWSSLYHPSIIEIFSQAKLDFIGIDLEHSTINDEQTLHMIAACQANQTLCLPRIATLNEVLIKRVLDSGADGIIIPLISTEEHINQLVSWTKYPPLGKRSFGVARGHLYGFNFEEYTQNWNETSSIIIQIENIEGVQNISKLISSEHIDGVMIGPYDLSGSLGIPGQLNHPLVLEASQEVVQACKKQGKACGTHLVDPNTEDITSAISNGFTFIVLSSDIFLLWKWSERMRTLIQYL